MDKKYDVVALGELLIDFTKNGLSAQGNPVWEANPGGAPCNVLSLLHKLSHKTAFIGKVGNDMFGRQLEHTLSEAGVGTEGLIKDKSVNTTLAFVHTLEDGDRDFSFYRNPGADMMLSADDVASHQELIQDCKMFHFGSLSMTHENCRQATKMAVALAKKSGAMISFDPNLREPLWESLDNAKEQIGWGLSVSDIVKIADNEIVWFTGETDYTAAAQTLQTMYPNIKLLLVSLGRDGSMAFSGENSAFAAAYLRPDTIETTGAGDAFCGCVLHYVLEQGLSEYSEDEMKKMLTIANVAAALVTTRKGALKAMPDMNEILSTYLAGKIQGKTPGCKKHPMHLCQHTGEEECQFHKRNNVN